jgi:hypothetical protein
MSFSAVEKKGKGKTLREVIKQLWYSLKGKKRNASHIGK